MDATTKKENRTGTALLIWGIPEDIKKRFKETCRRKGVPMKDTVRNLLERFTQENTSSN